MVRVAVSCESGGENSYFMGNFNTLKYLACMLMDCNNRPMLYKMSANIFTLASVRDLSYLVLVNWNILAI